MKRKLFLYVFYGLIISASSCSGTRVEQLTDQYIISYGASDVAPRAERRGSCRDPLNYVPDSSYLSYFDKRIIRVNFHFPDDHTRANNFNLGEAEQYFRYMIENANFRLSTPEQMHLPEGNNTPAFPANYEYRITPSKGYEKEAGFYYETDDTLSYFVNKGRDRNNYDKSIIKKYAIDDDSILNAFIMPHHPDSLRSKTYKTFGSGIALGSSIKIGGIYQLGGPEWSYATLLNHEIGHVYGLSHAWGTDGCDDTPSHPNCFYQSGTPPCDGVVSNNMMDYNNSQMAISPCQLGKVHLKMADTSSFQRRLLVPTWCDLKTDWDIVIQDSVSWLGARDVSRNIVIEDGGVLRICCRLSMPPSSNILVKAGGVLILDEVLVHTDCEGDWQGIFVETKKNKKGLVYQIGNVSIEDVE